MDFDLIATTTFGIEGITAKELRALGYDDVKVDTSKVHFKGDEMDIAIANIHLRTVICPKTLSKALSLLLSISILSFNTFLISSSLLKIAFLSASVFSNLYLIT